jgi:hypothetical protein
MKPERVPYTALSGRVLKPIPHPNYDGLGDTYYTSVVRVLHYGKLKMTVPAYASTRRGDVLNFYVTHPAGFVLQLHGGGWHQFIGISLQPPAPDIPRLSRLKAGGACVLLGVLAALMAGLAATTIAGARTRRLHSVPDYR